MKSQKRVFLLSMVLFLPLMGYAQNLKKNVFLRTPQVVNYKINQSEITYSPVVSLGVGLGHRSQFIELATFINDNDIYGFYTFFGTTLKTKELLPDLNMFTSLFGEITYVPVQNQNPESFTHTTGVSFFLNHSYDWGSIGIPLILGVAFSEKSISLNSRIIFNFSINLN